MQVPVTVSVMSAAAIEGAGIKNLTELARFTPGLFNAAHGNGTVNRGQYNLIFRGLSPSQGLYQGKYFIDNTNAAWVGASKRVNARFGSMAPEHLNIELYVKNLLDDDQLIQGAVSSDFVYSPSGPCPPCYTAAAPPIVNGASSTLNAIFLGVPIKRSFRIRGTYDF